MYKKFFRLRHRLRRTSRGRDEVREGVWSRAERSVGCGMLDPPSFSKRNFRRRIAMADKMADKCGMRSFIFELAVMLIYNTCHELESPYQLFGSQRDYGNTGKKDRYNCWA